MQSGKNRYKIADMRKGLKILALLLWAVVSPALILFLWAVVSPAQAGAFLEAIEDMPLMEGLSENPEAGVSFHTKQGRLIEAQASGEIPVMKVMEFYAQTLPQMGWSMTEEGVFRRGKEILRISASPDRDFRTLVFFSLSPK